MTTWVSPDSFDGSSLAQEAKLSRVGTRANLLVYLREVWQRRSFAAIFAWFQIQAATARSTLGVAWIVVVPALQILIYGLIFGFVLGASKPANFIPFLIVGVAFFQIMSNAVTDGSQAIIGNQSLVNSLDFPRSLLPFAVMIATGLECIPVILIALVALPFLGESITWQWLWLLPVLGLILIFSTGVALFAARLAVFYRDFKQLLPFISRVLFYVSGIFWSIEKLTRGNEILTLLLWNNPFHLMVNLARSVTVTGYQAHPSDWLIASIWALGSFVAGLTYFWLAEEKYGRNV